MLQPKPKAHKRYLLYRLYVAIVFIGELISVIIWFTAFASHGEPSDLQVIWLGALFPFFLIAIFMLMHIFVFPFKYSVLGDLERTPFPNEQPTAKISGTWGKIGFFRATSPFFSWYVYPSGVGISILGIGKVFIPAECIRSLNENVGSFFSGSRYQLVHSSPEVNSPIYLPDKALFETLGTIVKKGVLESSTEKIISTKDITSKSPKLNFFLIIAIIWGIPMMWFSLSTMYARLSIDLQGVIVSRQVIIDSYNVNRGTDYEIRQSDGKVIEYHAGASDPSLSRDIPVGATIVKKKWNLNYTINGNEVDDFPRVFYPLIGSLGFAIFASGLYIGIRRLRKQ